MVFINGKTNNTIDLNIYNTTIYIIKEFYCIMVADIDEELKKDLYINFVVKDNTKEMFIKLKKHYNLRYNMEMFRFAVKKLYDETFKDK